MPILTAACQRNGLVVPVVVGVSVPRELALNRGGESVPHPVKIEGLIDTGASRTAVDARVITRLRLPPRGTVDVWTVSEAATPLAFEEFDVILDVLIPPQDVSAASFTIPVIAAPLEALGVQALIGRDVLGKGMLIYNGQVRSFSLAF